MNQLKFSLAGLITVAALAAGGVAVAQPTSTAGNGCTATANAMKGGNLGGTASSKECGTTPVANTAVAPAAQMTTQAAPMTTTTTNSTKSDTAMTGSSSMGGSAPMATSRPTRVARAARADRN